MCLIALLVVRQRCMNIISFSQTIFYLLLSIVKYSISDINISYSVILYLFYRFPESLTFKMRGWKLCISIFGLQDVSTKRYVFFLDFYFPQRKNLQYLAQQIEMLLVLFMHGTEMGWLQFDCCAYKLAFNPPFYYCV